MVNVHYRYAAVGGRTVFYREAGNPAVQLKLYSEYPSNVALYPEVHAYFRSSQVPLLAV